MQHSALSRRERQIMDILYALGSATAAQVQEKLAGDLSYSTVRTHLRILEEKGHLTHTEDGTRYTYRPTVARDKARRSALRHLTDTFFEGSPWNVVTALLGNNPPRLTEEQLDKLSEIVERARKERSNDR